MTAGESNADARAWLGLEGLPALIDESRVAMLVAAPVRTAAGGSDLLAV